MARISLAAVVTCNPATAQHVSILGVYIDPNDKSVTVEWELAAPNGAPRSERRVKRLASPGVTSRVNNVLGDITAAILADLGVAGVLDP